MDKNESLPSPASREYLEDSNWAHEHLAELASEYPNQWVAIVNKMVVAAGRVISEVERMAREKTGRQEFPVILAEKGLHVY